jgi:hypothetical protein
VRNGTLGAEEYPGKLWVCGVHFAEKGSSIQPLVRLPAGQWADLPFPAFRVKIERIVAPCVQLALEPWTRVTCWASKIYIMRVCFDRLRVRK